MRFTKEKLAEFVVGVAGGTLLIAGILSLGSGTNMSRLWIVFGVAGIVAARFIGRRARGR